MREEVQALRGTVDQLLDRLAQLETELRTKPSEDGVNGRKRACKQINGEKEDQATKRSRIS